MALDGTSSALEAEGVSLIEADGKPFDLSKHNVRIYRGTETQNPDALILAGTEATICGDAVDIQGDHAAREETSFGMALFPELVALGALTTGRDDSVWPGSQPPPADRRHPKVEFDPTAPLFAQVGEDARKASAEHGEKGIAQVVDHLSRTINDCLNNP